jgi:hypothetical protein
VFCGQEEEGWVTGVSGALLSVVLWTGTAQVDVMIWEGGGEHPYTTDFTLEYRESQPIPVYGPQGDLVGHHVRLVPQRIALKAHHEVRGLLNCTGGGEEVIAEGPGGELVVPIRGKQVEMAVAAGVVAPSAGAYQLVLPRAVGAFACGNKRNTADRRVGIGRGLFFTDVEVADAQLRSLDGGSNMRGAYHERHERNYGGSPQHLVRYEFNVKWDLHRVGAPQ